MMQSAMTRGLKLSLELTISILILSLAFGLLGMVGLALMMGVLRSLAAY